MMEHDLPENIVFAFTGDEESCTGKGAIEASRMLQDKCKCPVCIALDVTWEGADQNMLCTIENVSLHRHDFSVKQVSSLFSRLAELALSIESEETQTLQFVFKNLMDMPENLPPKYVSANRSMWDEATIYAKQGCLAFSLCLPIKGSMHSQEGALMKAPVFEGYILNLVSVLHKMSKYAKEFVYGTVRVSQIIHKDTEIHKADRAACKEKAARIKWKEQPSHSSIILEENVRVDRETISGGFQEESKYDDDFMDF